MVVLRVLRTDCKCDYSEPQYRELNVACPKADTDVDDDYEGAAGSVSQPALTLAAAVSGGCGLCDRNLQLLHHQQVPWDPLGNLRPST